MIAANVEDTICSQKKTKQRKTTKENNPKSEKVKIKS
jgi:hypothetical protein